MTLYTIAILCLFISKQMTCFDNRNLNTKVVVVTRCLSSKSWYDDEAVVTGYAEGSGRHERRTGSLVARMACVRRSELELACRMPCERTHLRLEPSSTIASSSSVKMAILASPLSWHCEGIRRDPKMLLYGLERALSELLKSRQPSIYLFSRNVILSVPECASASLRTQARIV